MYPLLLKPVIKDYLWGGNKLKTIYNKESESNILAESWELSCHKDGLSIISNGILSETTLKNYIDSDKKNILGIKCSNFDYFPILVKFIDAKENLSIQVHPNNKYALKNEGQYGKTEMWYIIDCEPNSYIYYGFNRKLSKEELKERILKNTLLEALNAVKVEKGDVFFIEPGTIHAICSGILLAEIQQNSNITYRVYDYNRIGNDGIPRDLHIDKALDVTTLEKLDYDKRCQSEIKINDDYEMKLLAKCKYFTTYDVYIKNEINFHANGESFHCLLCLSGNLIIESSNANVKMEMGNTVFIPANLGEYIVRGHGEILYITI